MARHGLDQGGAGEPAARGFGVYRGEHAGVQRQIGLGRMARGTAEGEFGLLRAA